jgi:hypothetical protein
MPSMNYLQFYLDRECVIVPGFGKTKKVRSGCGNWKLADTQRNLGMLKNNAKLLNGTGGLLVVDVDPKNGGSVEALRRRFPDLPATRMVRTVTPHPDGLGTHLIFTMPDDVRLNWRELGAGIDIPPAVMLPGSVVRCADGVDRTYELVDEIEPAPAPLGLLAIVDKGEDSGVPADVVSGPDADEAVAVLVSRFANARDGERNQVFTQVAPAVIRLKGAEGANMLRYAYSGDEDKWLEIALKGAMEKFAGAAGPTLAEPSKYFREALLRVEFRARYGKWDGAAGPTDRRVLLAIARICKHRQKMTTVASIRTLALVTGLEPKTVRSSSQRLIESGHVCVVGKDDDGSPEYAPTVPGLTTVVSKEESPLGDSLLDPLHVVWLGDGLGGRHSQVFDLVSVGIRSAKQIATAGGMGYSTARGVLTRLVGIGLLERHGTAYSVPNQVADTADRLSLELGGRAKHERLAARIQEERARPRGDASLDASDDGQDDELRRWHEEELMRQLGII